MSRVISVVTIFFLAACCCNFQAIQSILAAPTPPEPFTSTFTALPENTPPFISTSTPLPATVIPVGRVEQVESMFAYSSLESWEQTVKDLSGDNPVTVSGETFTIVTRLSSQLFSGNENARAMDYLLMRVGQLVPAKWIETVSYEYKDEEGTQEWYNLIVTIPGTTYPEEEILLTAHMDSTTYDFDPNAPAPGADDNASGVAALLEGLKIFSHYSFERTIKVIFFSGEEYGLWGSRAYTEQNELNKVKAVINLDVISYDPNNDQCADLHAGTLPQSQAIGQLMIQLIKTYALDLQMELFTADAIWASDHAPFWESSTGAVLLSANLIDGSDSSCEPAEFNPYMHTKNDTIDKINPYTAYELTRLAIITVIQLAVPFPQ